MASNRRARMETEAEPRIRFCALAVTAEATDTRWPESKWKNGLTWKVVGDLPGFTRAAFTSAVASAFYDWHAVCGLPPFREVSSSAKANIVVTTGQIDGPSSTLGWSTLPPADPVEQRYDVAEGWNRTIYLDAVLCHEIGHALGLYHDSRNATALMAPYYNPAIRGPVERDIVRIQKLYGPPKPTPVPPPVDPRSADLVLKLTGMDSMHLTPAQDGSGLTVVEFRGVEAAAMPGFRIEKVG